MGKVELQRPLEDLARVFADVPIGFCVIDTELRYRYINPALAARNGLTVRDHLDQTVADILPNLASRIVPLLRQVLDTGKTVVASTLSAKSPRAPQGTVHFKNTYAPILGGDGQVISISCIVADVSEIEKSGQELQSHVNELETQVAARTADLAEVNQRLAAEIAESKLSETALRRSEQRFQDFANSSSDWLWEMDAGLRFTYMSPNVERVVGVPAEWHYGKTREDLLGEASDAKEWRGHLAALRRQQPFRDFVYLRQGEGVENRWLSSSGIPIIDDNGEFAGYRGVGSDVSDRMEAQEAQRRSEQRFRDFASMAADWFVETDANHKFTFMSESIALMDLSPSDFIGRNRQKLLHREYDQDQVKEEYDAIEAHRPFRNIERRSRYAPDIWLRTNGDPFFDENGMFQGYRITGTDITELKQKEAALRESEQRFRDFASVSADWLAETDADHVFTYMSESVSEIGLTPDDYVGKNRLEILRASSDPGMGATKNEVSRIRET